MRIVDLTVTIGPDTLSPPSVNKRLTLTSNYRYTLPTFFGRG